MSTQLSGWFAGPNAENSEQFARVVQSIYQDYVYWRRNYYPTDGVIVDSHARRASEPYWDEFADKLTELLAKLKADYPFHSPRYAAHMIAEQTLPSIAGMFAGLLYNPNNVSTEAAPVTVKMEIEVCQWLCRMLGYGGESWGHLTSGGTIANIESLWAARSVKFLPLVVRDIAKSLSLDLPEKSMADQELISFSPARAMQGLHDCFALASMRGTGIAATLESYRQSEYNVVEHGIGSVMGKLDIELVLLAPETCHYCIPKALDVLGFGRDAIEFVPVDKQFRMRSAALRSAIQSVKSSCKSILAVVGVAGTTEEGAIDPIHEIVEARAESEESDGVSFWIHADAAYGGYLRTMMVPERMGLGQPEAEVLIDGELRTIPTFLPQRSACDALAGLGECDSIAIDPHKLGYIPYPAGAVCFKSNLVKPVLRQDAPYIEGHAGPPSEERRSGSIGVYVLEGSKPGMVAASLWLSHSLIPLDTSGHGKLMQENVRNAGELYTLLKDYPEHSRGLKVRAIPLCEPNSNIVCFAFAPTGTCVSLKEINAVNDRVYQAFSDCSGGCEFFVSRTVLGPQRYRWASVEDCVSALGCTQAEYESNGLFLLRSVLMNPWYGLAKERGRYFLSEFVAALYAEASRGFAV